MFRKIKLTSFLDSLIFPILLLLLIILIFIYVGSERTIYYWDHTIYWFKYIRLSQLAAKDILHYGAILMQSLEVEEYNNLPLVLLTPFYLLWGASRKFYIISIVVTYGIMSFVSLLYLLKHISSIKKFTPLISIILFISFFLSVDVLGPVFRGYVDIGGLFFVFIILALYYSKPNWSGGISGKSLFWVIVLSFLLALLPLYRRYFVNFVISFLVSLPLLVLLWSRKQTLNIRAAGYWLLHYSLLYLFMGVFFLMLSGNLYQSLLEYDYGHLYSAWRQDFSYLNATIRVIKDFGIIQSFFFVVCFIYALVSPRYRKIAVLLLSIIVLSTLLFWRIQYFDYHHYYLLLGPILIVQSLFLIDLLVSNRSRILIISIIIFICFNFSQSFHPLLSSKKIQVAGFPVFSGKKLPPLVRSDLPTLERMLADIYSVWKDGEIIYIGASSSFLSDDIVRNACYLEYGFEFPFCNSILGSTHIDSRDGFPLSMLPANFIVITYPIQYHLSADQQKTVAYVNSFIEKNLYKYQLYFLYTIDQGIRVEVYKNIIPVQKRNIRDWDDLEDS